MEIVIMAIIGVINGVLGTPNAMLGRLFMTFSGSYGFLAFAAICVGFYISGPLCGYIIRGAQPEPECLCGALGQVGKGGVLVQGHPLRRALPAARPERIRRALPC
jgi:hypothetical protein